MVVLRELERNESSVILSLGFVAEVFGVEFGSPGFMAFRRLNSSLRRYCILQDQALDIVADHLAALVLGSLPSPGVERI